MIHELVLDGASKINYFRSRRIRWYKREVQAKMITAPIFEERNGHDTQHFDETFGKTFATELYHNLGGPAVGSAPGKVLRPTTYDST